LRLFVLAPIQCRASSKRTAQDRRWAISQCGSQLRNPASTRHPQKRYSDSADPLILRINARCDTVATKPAFRAAYKKRHCLELADGYYEWKTRGKAKLPQLYEIDGGKPFAFAGLWEQWWGPEKSDQPPLESCTIITTDANDLARQVHDRMPVILDPPDYDAWLEPANQDVAYMLDGIPPDRMTVRPVSTFVNNARNEGTECIAPLA